MTAKGLGGRLLEARLQLGQKRGADVRKADVARALDVTGTTVGRWEADEKEPDLETIVRLARYLEVSPAWLAFGDNAKESATPPLRGPGPNAVRVPDPRKSRATPPPRKKQA
jgi:transcriptional regulator with XRE-family HTH domain